jgi:molybdopterin converting factor small subunit
MSVTVELTYDMTKAFGAQRLEVDAGTVAEAVEAARKRLADKGVEFEKLSSRAAVAVNGVLVNHRRGMRTRLADGDVVAFVKAAAGG